MKKDVEFENEITGGIRRFPEDLFQSLLSCLLFTIPEKMRDTLEKEFSVMLANYLDTDPKARPILQMAELRRKVEALRAFTWINSPTFGHTVFTPEVIAVKLARWADRIFARYGHPVLLVGSSLTGGGNDVDIRVVMPNHDFESRFPGRAGWSQEVGKQGIHAALLGRMNVDFQIQSADEAREFTGKPSRRLDSNAYPEGFEPPQSGIGG
jgi:hypothetical protein